MPLISHQCIQRLVKTVPVDDPFRTLRTKINQYFRITAIRAILYPLDASEDKGAFPDKHIARIVELGIFFLHLKAFVTAQANIEAGKLTSQRNHCRILQSFVNRCEYSDSGC